MIQNKYKILLVEDEKNIRNLVATMLETEGYQTIHANSCSSAKTMFNSYLPELVILDLGLPDMDGMEVLQSVRVWSSVPVIVISARNQEKEKVAALDAGADDYITKPFGTSELLARIRTALRHSNKMNMNSINNQRPYRAKELVIDFEKRRVFLQKQDVHLTQVEYKMVSLLARNAGKVICNSICSSIGIRIAKG